MKLTRGDLIFRGPRFDQSQIIPKHQHFVGLVRDSFRQLAVGNGAVDPKMKNRMGVKPVMRFHAGLESRNHCGSRCGFCLIKIKRHQNEIPRSRQRERAVSILLQLSDTRLDRVHVLTNAQH